MGVFHHVSFDLNGMGVGIGSTELVQLEALQIAGLGAW
jgi:hypothetical protein